MNFSMIAGRVEATPEMRYTPEAKAVLKLKVMVERPPREDRDPNDTAIPFSVVVFGKEAERVERMVPAGTFLLVRGRMRPFTYRGFGGKGGGTWWELVADLVEVLVPAPQAGA